MRIHHLNCISTCPVGGRLMDGHSRSMVERGHLSCHCLLLEGSDGLILVDTGLGLEDVANPRGRLSRYFLAMLRPDFREEMTAARQIERLGFAREDVRHIILSHLDFDHAGGLDDFPQATVHLLQRERDYALRQLTWLDRQRFRPQQWSTRQNWKVYEAGAGDQWLGFDCIRDLDGLREELLMVPLPGHTRGHTGIAVKTDDRWLLLAADAYFYHAEMRAREPYCTPGLRLYQRLMEKDRQARLDNQRRLRELLAERGGEVEVFCSHDVHEFERMAGRPVSVPVERLSGKPPSCYH